MRLDRTSGLRGWPIRHCLSALALAILLVAPVSARAANGGLFDFLRQAFEGPPAASQQPAQRAGQNGRIAYGRMRAPTRRDYIRSAGRREPGWNEDVSDPRFGRRRERVAALHLKTPPSVEFKQGWREPDFSGAVDAGFLAREQKAYEGAAAGRSDAGWMSGRQTMCVRLCDGYAFPVGTLRGQSELSMHQNACQAGCPGAETALFSRPSPDSDLKEAISVGGRPYSSLRTAFAFRVKKIPACACNGDGAKPAVAFKIERDQTLQAGDAVMGRSTMFTLLSGRVPKFTDYRRDSRLSKRARLDIEKLVGYQPPRTKVRVQLGSDEEAPTIAEPIVSAGADTAETSSSPEDEVRVVLPRIY